MTESSFDLDLRRIHDQQIRAWFGDVRPLRLEGSGRFFTPPPALPLRAVFVPPALSASYFQSTVGESHLSGGADVLHWLGRQRRLVVLGDPGSGKSTLVSWLAWRLCAGLTEALPDWAEGALPVPMILRDMQLENVNDFDDLLAAYVRTDVIAGHPQLRQAWVQHLQRVIERQPGSLLFLIDGLDELSEATQDSVRNAIREGMVRIDARFMVTSRIVGYEQCAIETPDARPQDLMEANLTSATLEVPATLRWAKTAASGNPLAVNAQRLYVMPFDNGRIRQFARNWFEHGETDERRGEAYLEKFIAGVMRDPVALQLARTPNLLVMAAQVFGITNTLPDGRAKLYEAITKAYLESIDQRYGLVDQRYSLEQKKAWLAAVGYQMQLRRSAGDAGSAVSAEGVRDLLVAEADVVAWLNEAMRDSDLEPNERYATEFVNAIARRSGLFIPRAEGQYAFAHLSIQEYFAALHLQNGVRDLAVSDPARLQALFDELAQLGAAPAWREALVTFFELPEWSPKVIGTLFQAVFGQSMQRVPEVAEHEIGWVAPKNAALVETLARLVVNPGIALPAALREQGFQRVVIFLQSERQQKHWHPVSGVLAALTVNEEGSRRIWQLLRAKPGLFSGSDTVMDLRGARLVDFSALSGFSELTDLRLEDTLIADLSPLAGMFKLVRLSLRNTQVSSLEPLAALTELQVLHIDYTPVTSLGAIAHCTRLTQLSLAETAVTDLSPVSRLDALELLVIDGCEVDDLAAVVRLRNLLYLLLNSTRVHDLTPVKGLTKLELLAAAGTPVVDLTPLSGLGRLRALSLDGTAVSNLSGLQGLGLTSLHLNSTQVRHLQALASLDKLGRLGLDHTPVTDLSPLARLKELRELSLSGSQVTDTSPLGRLTELTILGGPDGPKAKPRAKSRSKKR